MEGSTRPQALVLLFLCAAAAYAEPRYVAQAGISARLDRSLPLVPASTLPISPAGIAPVLAPMEGDVSEYLTPAPSPAHRPLPFVRTGGTRVNTDGRDAGDSSASGAVSGPDVVQLAAGALSVHRKQDGALSAGPFDVRLIFNERTSSAASRACGTGDARASRIDYDRQAHRWLLLWQASPDMHCLAVSASSDPAGRYFPYLVRFGAPRGIRLHLDDARMAVWPGAYLLSFSLLDAGRYRGPRMCVIAREAMLRGARSTIQCLDGGPRAGPVSPVAYQDPGPAASGHLALFAGLDADSTGRGKAIALWRWPASGNAPAVPVTIETQRFLLSGQGVAQPPPGHPLAALADRISPQAVLVHVDGVATLAASHPVILHDGRIGMRWLAIGDPLGAPYVMQQGTLDTGAGNRWMGSIGIDRRGNLALGYMVASGDTFAGIRYTGREPGDPPGMLQGEEVIVNGGGVATEQRDAAHASGALALDPADGCTFWYVQRYLPLTAPASWRTRIASFQFRSCY